MPFYISPLLDEILSNLKKEDKAIIIDAINGKEMYSFELLERIQNLSSNMQKIWFTKGNLAVIFIRNSIDFITIVLATILSGWKVALLDPWMWQKLLHEKLHLLSPDYIFIDWLLYDLLSLPFLSRILRKQLKNLDGAITTIPNNIIISGLTIFGRKYSRLDDLYKPSFQKIYEKIHEDEDAIIVFTWWTTGKPKWVVHSLRSLHNTIAITKNIIWDTRVFYADLPHFILIGIMCNSLVIASKEGVSNEKFLQILKKYKVDTIFSSPFKFLDFIEKNITMPSTLTKIFLGSTPIYKSFLMKIKSITSAKIICIYGMTEILPIAFIDGDEKLKINSDNDLLWQFISGVDYKIVRNELYLKWIHLFKNYLFQKHSEWHATGDLVKIEHGNLIMMGRKKDMIIRKNYNIYPSLYESIISSIPWVRTCALIGFYRDLSEDEEIILFIENETWYSFLEKEIFKLLRHWEYSIDEFAIPNRIFFQKIPLIGRQKKIDKWSLRNSLIWK